MVNKIANRRYKKKKTKETTDPNLNDLEINDNSTIDNLITIPIIDYNYSNL